MCQRVDVRPVMDLKYAALAEHRSQIAPGGDRLSLSSAQRRSISPTENFTLVASGIATTLPENDLFAGLR